MQQTNSLFGIPINVKLPPIFTDKTTRIEAPDGLFDTKTDYMGPIFLLIVLAAVIGGGYYLINKK